MSTKNNHKNASIAPKAAATTTTATTEPKAAKTPKKGIPITCEVNENFATVSDGDLTVKVPLAIIANKYKSYVIYDARKVKSSGNYEWSELFPKKPAAVKKTKKIDAAVASAKQEQKLAFMRALEAAGKSKEEIDAIMAMMT